MIRSVSHGVCFICFDEIGAQAAEGDTAATALRIGNGQWPSRGGGHGATVLGKSAERPDCSHRPQRLHSSDTGCDESRRLEQLRAQFQDLADRATSSTINVFIRGVGQSDPLWGNEPGVGLYIDDVYLARPQTALLDVIDVDQDIEILRGPQGTLYGKNTIAGAIKYVTRDIDGPASCSRSRRPAVTTASTTKISTSRLRSTSHVYFGIASRTCSTTATAR